MNLLVVPQEILEFRDLKVNKYNMKEKGFESLHVVEPIVVCFY